MSEINFIASECELEELNRTSSKIGMPRIWAIEKKEYEQYKIRKRYVYGLEYRWQEEAVEALLTYFRNSMANTDEIEFWSVWLNESEEETDIYKKSVLISKLDYSFFNQFCEIENDVKCLVIRKKNY